MSEDRFEKDEPKDEDVEAHKRKANDELAQDDVEAHSHKRKANDEPGSDESDDVEAHVKRR
jgi:hypothetical protein